MNKYKLNSELTELYGNRIYFGEHTLKYYGKDKFFYIEKTLKWYSEKIEVAEFFYNAASVFSDCDSGYIAIEVYITIGTRTDYVCLVYLGYDDSEPILINTLSNISGYYNNKVVYPPFA